MTLKTTMVSDISDVFMNTDEMSESVTFLPGQNELDETTITVNWFDDHEEGTRENHGDGVTLNRDQGKKLRRSAIVEMASTVDLNDTRKPPDTIIRADGTVWSLQRITARDDGGLTTALFVRSQSILTRRPVKSG